MKTNNVLWIAILAVLFSVSCEKEKQFQKTGKEQNTDKKTIIVGGQAIYAGYGYDPIEDRAFRNAIHPNSIYESTEIQPALSVDVRGITERLELEDHVKDTYTITKKSSKFLGLSKKTHTTTREIESFVKINSQSIAFIVKVKAKHQRFFTDATPELIPPAKRLLEQKKYDRFVDNYGHFYVSNRTTGGEVTYVYSYSYCMIDRWSRETFIKKTESKLLGIFGKKGTTSVTESDKQHIETARTSVHMLSSIPGFAPQMVLNEQDANREIQRIQDYLNANPQKATSVQMELKPYADLWDAPELKQKLAEKEKCIKVHQNFEEYHDKVNFVYQNASGFEYRLAAEEMMEYDINKSGIDCNDDPVPAETFFNVRYGNANYNSSPCDNFSPKFRLKFYVGDENNKRTGATRYTNLFNEWSAWASMTNYDTPDYIKIGLERIDNKPFRMVGQDFRIVVQMADFEDGRVVDVGTPAYSPWFSEYHEDNEWSDWAYSDNWNFNLVRFKIETRSHKNLIVKDFRVGIQMCDRNKDITQGHARYTPYMQENSTWAPKRATDNNFNTPSQVRVYLEPLYY